MQATGRGTIVLTAEGRKELETELARREAELPSLSARIATARAEGSDPTENLDLRDALEELTLLETRIAELRALLAAAETLSITRPEDGALQLGATALVRHADGEEASYLLVLPLEANPRRGRISIEAPIGRALLGRRKGERVSVETPGGMEEITLLDVA